MDLSKILSIAGKSGLYKVVSQAKSAVIVESISDHKRFPAFSHEKMSSLEEISVFTTGEDLALKDVFKAFHQKLDGKPGIDPKAENKELMQFFLEMVPEFDSERVYASDIRKMVSWYNMLLEKDLLDFSEPEEAKPEEGTTEGAAPEETDPEGSVEKETVDEKPADEKV